MTDPTLEAIKARLDSEKYGEPASWGDLRYVVARLETAETSIEAVQINLDSMTKRALRWQERAEASEAETAALHKIIADPVAVWINMLRGTIAKPEGLVEAEQRAMAAEAEVERLRAERTFINGLLNNARDGAAPKPKTLRDCGYAPGNYWCRCSQCDSEHTADKRAWRCLECATSMLKAGETQ